jgi:hypothetical protein
MRMRGRCADLFAITSGNQFPGESGIIAEGDRDQAPPAIDTVMKEGLGLGQPHVLHDVNRRTGPYVLGSI